MSSESEDGSSSEAGYEDESGFVVEAEKHVVSTTENNQNDVDMTKPSSSTGSNARDPLRQRRRKARRACYACQRAHLTCGDERPCVRCVKRGLEQQCQDGVRKRAKYLHDAPPEALNPGYGGHYHPQGQDLHQPTGASSTAPMAPHGVPVSQPVQFNPLSHLTGGYAQFGAPAQQSPMGPPGLSAGNIPGDYATDTAPETSSVFPRASMQQMSSTPDGFNATGQTSPLDKMANPPSFDDAFYGTIDPSAFNFNLPDLNFENRYGALEFGMLGHMSSGALNTPAGEELNALGQINPGSVSYDGNSAMPSNFDYNQFPPWQDTADVLGQNGSSQTWNFHDDGADAFAVGEHNPSVTGASPHSQGHDFSTNYSSSSTSPQTPFSHTDANQHNGLFRQSVSKAQRKARKPSAFPDDPSQPPMKKKRRDTSEIYAAVTAPYPYTTGFHGLVAFLKSRYSPRAVVRIAKALAAIRPSFISCNQGLNHDDLIFMEKCFQRALHEYDDFVNCFGTPTVICRRTGEVVAASKEFSLVTGWRLDVLLGKEPNLNINTENNASGTETGSSSKGTATPHVPNIDVDPNRLQPVFLPELMDEDSTVTFYDNFAELAFGASGSSIIGEPCSLLKYKTSNDPVWPAGQHLTATGKRGKKSAVASGSQTMMQGEADMYALGEKDGRVNAMMCWTVKRDMFDIPMFIVMNFLPII